MAQADYIMVGGFLGAGKTTALLRLAEYLTARGRRVGLITNDQSSGLVDTTLVASQGYPVQEITGGCFCCRFQSLTAAAEQLTVEAAPDVFLAEPVGSCTDLRASVQYPLRRLYGDAYRIAPLSVLVDPVRALRVLGVEPGRAFSPKVQYVYRTQLDEAEIVVINKADLLEAARLARLDEALRAACPAATLYAVSARTGAGLDAWFERIVGSQSDGRRAPDVDYDVYADGEALLGWLNATVRLAAPVPFDGNRFLTDLAGDVRARLSDAPPEIAHFKMTLTADDGLGDLAVLNLVGSDRQPELSHTLQDDTTGGELIVNLRAEGSPDLLRTAVTGAVAAAAQRVGAGAIVAHIEHFRPARPSPTHRMATAETV
jgi:Ni2+-binding GTPase involved in maturation of urease and hydrogenase